MVMRWDPFGEALALRDAMNRLFEQAVLKTPSQGTEGAVTYAPALDVHESENGYTIKVSLAGVKPEDVSIQYQKGVLSISGESHEASNREEGTYHVRERRWGRFSRSVSLPETVNAERAEATFDGGVLTLSVPKAEETKPRQIEIKAGSGTGPAIEAGRTNGQPVGASTN
jgi:HSP20 family protein